MQRNCFDQLKNFTSLIMILPLLCSMHRPKKFYQVKGTRVYAPIICNNIQFIKFMINFSDKSDGYAQRYKEKLLQVFVRHIQGRIGLGSWPDLRES